MDAMDPMVVPNEALYAPENVRNGKGACLENTLGGARPPIARAHSMPQREEDATLISKAFLG